MVISFSQQSFTQEHKYIYYGHLQNPYIISCLELKAVFEYCTYLSIFCFVTRKSLENSLLVTFKDDQNLIKKKYKNYEKCFV